jgi:SulP family sulfate permease
MLSAPLGDIFVLVITLALTVLVDLTFAIEVGVVLAAILFMHRMAEVVSVQKGVNLIAEDVDDFDGMAPERDLRANLPENVEVFQLRGPLFFGAASVLQDVLDRIVGRPPRAFILRMRDVPLIDASGVGALKEFARRCKHNGTLVIVTGVQPQPQRILAQMGFGQDRDGLRFAENFDAALALLTESGAAR